MDEAALAVYRAAELNKGRYLLPRRRGAGDDKKDALYDACKSLVDEGFANWVMGATFSPAIRLTGKPLSQQEHVSPEQLPTHPKV